MPDLHQEGSSNSSPRQVATSVDVWLWDLDDNTLAIETLKACLSSDEQVRADRYATKQLHDRWVRARAGMRLILAERLGANAKDLRFQLGEHGKPSVVGGHKSFHFNLSHSRNQAVLAISNVPVGADIEHIGEFIPDVAETFFSQQENCELRAMSDDCKRTAFYRVWTAKEAVLKAIGVGLSQPTKSFTVKFVKSQEYPIVTSNNPKIDVVGIQVRRLDVPDGFSGAVVVSTANTLSVTTRIWKYAL